jgi:GNAT superfamily N-acetyltransferase
MIRVEKIEILEDLLGLGPTWNDLVNEAGCDEIFLSHEWITSWWRIFAGTKKLFVLVAKSEEKTVGIAPLMLTSQSRLGRTAKTLEIIGRPDSSYYDFISLDAGATAEAIAAYLHDHKELWTHLEFPNIGDNSRFLKPFGDSLKKRGYKPLMRTSRMEALPTAPKPASGETGGQEGCDSSLAAIKKWGDPELEEICELKELNSNMPVFFQVHINSKRMAPFPSKFNHSLCRRFYYDFVKAFAPQKKVFMARLRAGEILVSYGLCFLSDGVVRVYDIASNLLFHNHEPDRVFLQMLAERFRRQGYQVQCLDAAELARRMNLTACDVTHDLSVCSGRLASLGAQFRRHIAELGPVAGLLGDERVKVARGKMQAISYKKGKSKLLTAFAQKAMEAIGQFIVFYREYYIYRHSGGSEKAIRIKVDIEIKKFEIADIDRIASFYGIQAEHHKYETFKKRFEKGADCYAALHHGYPVSMIWGLHHEDYHREFNISLEPAKDEVVLSDALTAPIYRSMGTGHYILSTMLNEYHRTGYKAIAGVLKSNTPSRKGLESFDFKHIRTMRILKIFRIRII